jgi:hypothetical protein
MKLLGEKKFLAAKHAILEPPHACTSESLYLQIHLVLKRIPRRRREMQRNWQRKKC